MLGGNVRKRQFDAAELKVFRKELEAERNRLRQDAASFAEQRANSEGRPEQRDAGSHQADVATEAFDDEVADSLNVAALERLEEIEAALARIKDRSYGICVDCDKPIPKGRLEARPWATRCVDCQSQLERVAA
jgi:DnaK suppressor protein